MKHIVGFSGGVDSQACARWVLNRFPKDDVILTNSSAGGWEDPLTIEFVQWYSDHVHPVTLTNAKYKDVWDTEGYAETKGLDSEAELSFEELVRLKGRPPSRKAQFCTDILKLRPQRRWIKEAFGIGGIYEGQDYCRYTGKRRDESNTRRDTPFESWDQWFDCPLFAPLADWTKPMCFAYVQAHGEEVNPLYKLGFKRVGCAPCINNSKEDIVNWAVRRPEMIDKVRGLEERTGRTFFVPVDRDGQINRVDEVVLWAKTKRGGSEILLPMMFDRPPCESKYGLCE